MIIDHERYNQQHHWTMADETEQQLRAKIASQRAAIDELPSLTSIVEETGLTSPETKARAQQIKELSDNEEQLELLLESKRVEAVISLQDELHPPQNSEDCPICLETIKYVNNATTCRFLCCGGWACKKCGDERNANCDNVGFDVYSNKCPLCRRSFHTDYKEVGARVLEHSNKGAAWAQYLNGAWCLKPQAKRYGLPFDEKKGWKLIEQAADQGDPDASLLMTVNYGVEEMTKELNKLDYLRTAADLGGLPPAQHNLALFNKENRENEKYLHYITLAASQGYSSSCGVLGNMFTYAECGLERSLILAKHYAGKNLEDDFSLYIMSFASWFLVNERYEGVIDIPGHSPVPKFLSWGRRALEGDLDVKSKDFLTNCMSMLEVQVKSHCVNCRKEATCASFKRCVRCLGAWYCGKECQVQHWKAGHKIDCVSIKRNK